MNALGMNFVQDGINKFRHILRCRHTSDLPPSYQPAPKYCFTRKLFAEPEKTEIKPADTGTDEVGIRGSVPEREPSEQPTGKKTHD